MAKYFVTVTSTPNDLIVHDIKDARDTGESRGVLEIECDESKFAKVRADMRIPIPDAYFRRLLSRNKNLRIGPEVMGYLLGNVDVNGKPKAK